MTRGDSFAAEMKTTSVVGYKFRSGARMWVHNYVFHLKCVHNLWALVRGCKEVQVRVRRTQTASACGRLTIYYSNIQNRTKLSLRPYCSIINICMMPWSASCIHVIIHSRYTFTTSTKLLESNAASCSHMQRQWASVPRISGTLLDLSHLSKIVV